MGDLLEQIKQENQLGKDYINPKKQQILERLKKHIKQNKTPWLMNINMISNTIDTLIAGSYIDEPQVKFVSRDMFYENEQANNLNNMAKFDSKEQDYQQIDYQVQWDRYFFGLGIKYRHWFDTTLLSPIFYAVNPVLAIYDPTPTLIGKYKASQYKYFGFYMNDSMFNLKNDPQYDKASLSKLMKTAIDNDKELYKQAMAISDNTQVVCDDLLLNYNVELYHHFTIYNGSKWLVTLDAELKTIVRQVELKAVLKEEKKNPMLIPRPFAFYFYKPERWKVLGVSVPDLLEDKEQAKTILVNANIIKANLEAYWGKFVVNSRIIKNKEDILKPSTWPKYFFADLPEWQPLQNAMMELPTSAIKQDPLSMTSIIEREAVMDTKTDQMQMWVVPDKTMTKAEQQSVQGNANMLSALNLKTYMRGEYDFRFLRWRTYQEYFSVSDEKFLLMQDDFEWKSVWVKKDWFITKNNPFIVVGSKSDVEAMTEKQKSYWNAMLPIIMNDPDISKMSKLFAKRFVARLNNMSPNKVNEIYPLLPWERKAKNDVEYLINDNIIPKGLFSNPNEDLDILWMYYNRADDTDAKTKVLWVLEKALIDMWWKQQIQQMNEQANSAGNIMSSQLAQQNGMPQTISKQNVLEPTAMNG